MIHPKTLTRIEVSELMGAEKQDQIINPTKIIPAIKLIEKTGMGHPGMLNVSEGILIATILSNIEPISKALASLSSPIDNDSFISVIQLGALLRNSSVASGLIRKPIKNRASRIVTHIVAIELIDDWKEPESLNRSFKERSERRKCMMMSSFQ